MYERTGKYLTSKQLAEVIAVAKTLDPNIGPGGSGMSDFETSKLALAPLLHACGFVAGELLKVTVVSLLPSQQIVGHCDQPIKGIRYHVQLEANSGCWSFHDGVWQQLEVGAVYQMNPAIEHGAVNWGTTTRLNLMFDVG